MKITGYRTLTTAQHWGRPVGDVNGFISDGHHRGARRHHRDRRGTRRGRRRVARRHRAGVPRARGPGSPRHRGALRPDAGPGLQVRTQRGDVRRHRRPGHGAVGPQGEAGRRAAVAHPRAPGTATSRATRRRWRSPSTTTTSPPSTRGWVDRGFTSVKVKGGLDLDRDRARLATIRDLFTANTAASGADVRLQRVVEPQAGDPLHLRARGRVRPDLGRGAVAAVGRRGPGHRESCGARRHRHRREPDRARAVQAAAGRQCGRHRPDQRGVGHHELPPGRHRRAQPRPADQPGRLLLPRSPMRRRPFRTTCRARSRTSETRSA